MFPHSGWVALAAMTSTRPGECGFEAVFQLLIRCSHELPKVCKHLRRKIQGGASFKCREAAAKALEAAASTRQPENVYVAV